MGSNCSNLEDGKAVVNHIKEKQKAHMPSKVIHELTCECGQEFLFKVVITNCPSCGMTYAVTPCSSGDIRNIKAAGIHYA